MSPAPAEVPAAIQVVPSGEIYKDNIGSVEQQLARLVEQGTITVAGRLVKEECAGHGDVDSYSDEEALTLNLETTHILVAPTLANYQPELMDLNNFAAQFVPPGVQRESESSYRAVSSRDARWVQQDLTLPKVGFIDVLGVETLTQATTAVEYVPGILEKLGWESKGHSVEKPLTTALVIHVYPTPEIAQVVMKVVDATGNFADNDLEGLGDHINREQRELLVQGAEGERALIEHIEQNRAKTEAYWKSRVEKNKFDSFIYI